MIKSKFITLEGGEFVGKSTLCKGLITRFESHMIKTIQTREPGGTAGAEAIRELLLWPPEGVNWSPLAQAYLFNAARTAHIESKITPALSQGKWVICDRFIDSTMAYQSVSNGISPESIAKLDSMTLSDLSIDLTIILDAAPEAIADRLRKRGGVADIFEQKDISFHNAVRQAFLEIAKDRDDRCVILDALQTPEIVLDQAWKEIKRRFLVN